MFSGLTATKKMSGTWFSAAAGVKQLVTDTLSTVAILFEIPKPNYLHEMGQVDKLDIRCCIRIVFCNL